MQATLIDKLQGLPQIFEKYKTENTALPVGTAGKVAIQNLTFEKSGEKTYLTDLYSQFPARVTRPIYLDEKKPGLPYVFLISPAGGIVQGDRYTYRFILKPNAEAVITEVAATKIYKMVLNYASRHTDVYLGKKSRLEYVSQETIAFARSRWYQSTTFHLEQEAKLFYSEIFCPGRLAHGNEFWNFDVFASKLLLEQNGTPLLLDSAVYRGEDEPSAKLIFGGKQFLLNTYWVSKEAGKIKDSITFDENILGGVTEMPYSSGVVIKALSETLHDLKALQNKVWNIFRKVEVGAPVPSLRMY